MIFDAQQGRKAERLCRIDNGAGDILKQRAADCRLWNLADPRRSVSPYSSPHCGDCNAGKYSREDLHHKIHPASAKLHSDRIHRMDLHILAKSQSTNRTPVNQLFGTF